MLYSIWLVAAWNLSVYTPYPIRGYHLPSPLEVAHTQPRMRPLRGLQALNYLLRKCNTSAWARATRDLERRGYYKHFISDDNALCQVLDTYP